MVGYSGKSLADKLGFRPNQTILSVAAPAEYLRWLGLLPTNLTWAKRPSRSINLVHLFVTKRTQLKKLLTQYRHSLKPDVVVWISWPKKTSGVVTDITEDRIRDIALPLGWVDIKVCAVSEIWSGLKLMIRKTER